MSRPLLERLLDGPHKLLGRLPLKGDARAAVLSMVELAKQAVRSRRNRRDARR